MVEAFEIVPSQQFTADGASTPVYGSAIPVNTISCLGTWLRVTQQSASSTLNVWLQGSDDDGRTWYDLTYDTLNADGGAYNDGRGWTGLTKRRNINLGVGVYPNRAAGGITLSISPFANYVAIFRTLPWDLIRGVHVDSGANGQTATYSLLGVGK